MKVPFEQLPDSAKVWIYQSTRELTPDEANQIITQGELFVDSWTAHEAGLKAGIKVFNKYFVVIAVDESYNNASGCSIDKQVHFMQMIGEKLNVDFFNRMNVVCKLNDQTFRLFPVSDVNKFLDDGNITMQTITYNNLVGNLHELKTNWEVPIKNSWVTNFVTTNKV